MISWMQSRIGSFRRAQRMKSPTESTSGSTSSQLINGQQQQVKKASSSSFSPFTLIQHAGTLADDYWERTFSEMVHQIGRTLVVIDQFDAVPTALTRVWCIFELHCTTETSATRLEFCMTRPASASLDIMIQDPAALKHSCALIRSINCQDAKATVQADKVKIDALVAKRRGGHESVNRSVNGAILNALMSALVSRAQNDGVHTEVICEALDECDSVNQLWCGRSPLTWALIRNHAALAARFALLVNVRIRCALSVHV